MLHFLHLYITLQARSAIVAQTFCHSQEPGRCGRNSTAIWRLRWGRGPFAVGGKPGFANAHLALPQPKLALAADAAILRRSRA